MYIMTFVRRAWILICVAALVAIAAFAQAGQQPAVWVLRQGGAVALDGGRAWISDLADLPGGPLHVTGIDLSGTHINPEDLERIGGVTELSELYLPGYMWNNAAGSRM